MTNVHLLSSEDVPCASQTLSHPILLLSQIPDFRGRLDVEEFRTWTSRNFRTQVLLWADFSDYGCDRVEDRERDESAIILTSCSKSQRVHCPGKIGREGGGGKGARLTSLSSLIRHSQHSEEEKIIQSFFCFVLLHCLYKKDQVQETDFRNWKAIIIQESVSIHPWEDTIACLSPCLSGDNNLQFQNILTPQLSLSALAICLSWTQFIVNNYSRIVY